MTPIKTALRFTSYRNGRIVHIEEIDLPAEGADAKFRRKRNKLIEHLTNEMDGNHIDLFETLIITY